MARFPLPPIVAGLSYRIGHDDAVRNARAELDLAVHRDDVADEVIRRVQAAERRPAAGMARSPERPVRAA